MHWFKKHPEFLRAESQALSSDSNYLQIHQCRNNLFLSHGNIILRLEKVKKHPILIVYTDATPFQLPIIFPLVSELDRAEVEELASLSLAHLASRIISKVKFFYDLRHQNASGNLCILEWDNLEDGTKYYGATTILKRIRDWCAGLHTGKFPPDNQEVEYCAHFKNVDRENHFLYPEDFLSEQLTGGTFYAARVDNAEKREGGTYMGCLIEGFTNVGIMAENSRCLFPHIVHEKLQTSADFLTESSIVRSLTEKGKLLFGLWFHVGSTLGPFKGFEDLIKLIGNGDFDQGVSAFVKNGPKYFALAPDKFVIGVRYPNRKGKLEFQTYFVYKKENAQPIILDSDPQKKMLSVLQRYETVAAIQGEKFSEETFHLRNSNRAIREKLKNETLNIFGVGSLGSEMADCFAKAGIGHISLFDDQSLSASNPVRHLAGLNFVGASKTRSVAFLLRNQNPFVTVSNTEVNLYTPDVPFYLRKKSITVSSLADDNLEAFLNEQAVIADNTIFYVRALRGGKVARIFRVIPGKDACFQCLNLYRQEGKDFISIPQDHDLPTLFNECNNPVRPGSAADLKLISAFASRIIIDSLQTGMTKENHWIWSSEAIDGTPINEANKLYFQHFQPHSGCIYCNHDRKISVSIDKGALLQMQQLVSEKAGIETGGVLAGTLDDMGNIIITHASGPGPKAIHKQTEFNKDIEFCQKFLDDLYISSDHKTIYVGEWHSHPCEDNTPSGIDIKSLTEISLQKEYLTTAPAMFIFSNAGAPSCTVHPAGKRHYFVNPQII